MVSTSDGGDLVDLPGYTIPMAALKVALDLEDQGCVLAVHRNGKAEPTLRVSSANGGKPGLAPETQAAIRRWKRHLIALVDWVDAREV